VQHAAIEALTGDQKCVSEHNAIYQSRRDRLVTVLRDLGLAIRLPQASLYVWARIPHSYTSIGFTAKILEEIGIAVTPGVGYGPQGEGYIRLSITLPDADLEEGLGRLRQWKIEDTPGTE
ncbi:MAG: aminotransferase class I/II-fold pyridoxal phosphate-dependent enzyme, partial [Dehalococcoidia bacterium]|nr:aminotransferase class I/II-fold pyridoxal phosphate-dependent enzyme [Dehalococcoidia bacterium]